MAPGADLRIIPNAAQQTIGNARCSPCPPCHFFGGVRINRGIQQTCRPIHNRRQLGGVVVVQAQHQSEPASQGRTDQTLPRGGTDGGKFLQRNRVSPGSRSGPDQDVELEVLQRRIQHFFHIGQQTVDFVDEKHLSITYATQNPGKIEFLLQDWSGSLGECDFELLGDDLAEGGLAQTRGSVQQDMVHRLAALSCRVNRDLQVFL